eukprot:scaffold2874_cov110-Alexandrium_tamarense.AAC.35
MFRRLGLRKIRFSVRIRSNKCVSRNKTNKLDTVGMALRHNWTTGHLNNTDRVETYTSTAMRCCCCHQSASHPSHKSPSSTTNCI